ncbi:prolyl oligopeptidase family serine peptidase [Weeksella virosa]|uniref:prolyl oligopeptidase n=1 Tax=Weeksella virosa (strain ATCC 43766 / DSM 16922 / JCM 21250 / CCUG 30538 / CDC 9751 / IAM 14551 / NBRC 16016 / NCTC 11634 / CL345/78) TaxID=865938 RepID=F0P2N7_WEEVC|nr:prolyl oligopeptidase family serine peptidase [Weeksella virosa]ADX67876.1 Prolyl oligopeptidase [Weeksella virosa DSM 16922]MDK7374165.1 prolyl oligopeptidase family serine peptidase [Weeksella virosa]MDK7674477.1 prolyl oligopeptidase family serine peptidase [Weeksella virosa]SUP54179.1 Prolyl endopeptidase precursor [Weeksella virosa]VEH64497.1 Prolyl endopeptidase precursor [Weeksella virosa]
MKKLSVLLFNLGILMNLNAQDFKGKYPTTAKANHTDEYFGEKVADPYRWLEDDRSPQTKAWVEAENKVTFSYLDKIPLRNELKKQLTDIWNYEKVGTPFKEGSYTYYYKNNGLQQHSVLYRKKGENGKEEVFLDPNTFSKDGSTSLADVSFSKDGSLVAYSISEGGSDWRKVIVLNTENKQQIGETLVDVKFSGIAWKGNQGFYYSSYDKPKGSELSEKTDQHKVYFHTLNTPQKDDKLVFGGKETPRRYIGAYLTDDERFLVITAANTTTGNELYIQDLNAQDNKFIQLAKGFDQNATVVDNDGDVLYIQTNYKAPNNRLVKTNYTTTDKEKWQDVVAETENVLSISTAGKYFFAHYLKDAVTQIQQLDKTGKKVRDILLPGVGSAGGFSGKKDETEVYYVFSNYITPTTSYKFDLETGKSELYIKPAIKFNPENYESKQVFYSSKDGTKVPMIITYKKGLKLDGKNPTILYGYGGFNISLTPSFSVTTATWIENGGIYAVANLRGGGEYGKKWHDGGRQFNKLNVFDDFIAAAQYLHKNKYTSPEYTALSGGSNGGLLVGATMTIDPKIAKVALPAVGVLDMLRYHTFTAGAGWGYDYGTAEDSKEMFNYLKAYSPVHNVKKGQCYPATLVTTGDHDDRVVPAHSYKFAAELQDKQGCKNPVLIRIETKAGHGAGRSTEVIINETADKFAFTLWNMGIKNLKKK